MCFVPFFHFCLALEDAGGLVSPELTDFSTYVCPGSTIFIEIVRVSHRFEHTLVVREVHIQVIVELTSVSVVDDLNLVTCGTEFTVIDSKRTITCAERDVLCRKHVSGILDVGLG